MERKCLFCESSIDIKKHGLTKFCSAQCRNKFYYQNKASKEFDNSCLNKGDNEQLPNEIPTSKSSENIGSYRQPDIPVQSIARNNDSFIYSLIEAKFDAQNECNLYKLKCEKLEEERKKLEQELFKVNAELESFDEEENSGFLGILSGLPENVIAGVSKAAFENEHIRELIKSFVPKSV